LHSDAKTRRGKDQRPRRRDRDRPPTGRQRCANHRDAHSQHARSKGFNRNRNHVHWRRPRHRYGFRTSVSLSRIPSAEIDMAVQSTTLVKLFLDCVDRGGDRTALILPAAGDAQPAMMSWNDLALEVRRLAAGLRRTGVEPGDRIAQISENRYEWVLADLATHFVRGVHVALHASLSGQQIAWQIADCGARIVVLSTAAQVAKLSAIATALPRGLQFF